MHKLYAKSKLWFALAWIILYVVLSSIADSIEKNKTLTFALHLVMCAVLFLWLKKHNLTAEYGICKPQIRASKVLFYFPLALASTVNIWFGFDKLPSIFFLGSMLLVGILEEIIFRGFLFKAINDTKWAIIISSLTFGIGHIINLLNGASFVPTLCQIFSAMGFGFMFVILFYRTKSLLLAIFSHSFINVTSTFAKEITDTQNIVVSLILFIITMGYALFIIKSSRTGK